MVEEISRTRWKQEKDRYEDGETEVKESQEVNAKSKEFEPVSLDMAFKEDYKRLLGGVDLYERNLPRAFALIMKNYCTPQMVIRLKEISDHEARVRTKF